MARKASITIQLDGALKKQVQQMMKDRGTTIETFVRLQLRAMTVSNSMLTLHDKMNFGKYSREPVEDVVRANPDYIRWIVNQSATKECKFDADVLELLTKLP